MSEEEWRLGEIIIGNARNKNTVTNKECLLQVHQQTGHCRGKRKTEDLSIETAKTEFQKKRERERKNENIERNTHNFKRCNMYCKRKKKKGTKSCTFIIDKPL